MTYFQLLTHRFQPTEEEDSPILTEPFLDACTNFITFSDFLGPVLSRAKENIRGNITPLRERYESDPTLYTSIQQLIYNHTADPDEASVISLIWLKRAVEFVYHFLQKLISSPLTSLPQDAYHAYELSLRPFHGWIVRGLVYMLINIAPSKESLVQTLAQGDPGGRERLFVDIEEFIRPMGSNLAVLNKFLADNQLSDNTVV